MDQLLELVDSPDHGTRRDGQDLATHELDRGAGHGHGADQRPVTRAMRRVHDHRQVGELAESRDRGEVECLDPATGKTIWSDAFPKNRASYYASPLIAGGHLYAPREDGVVFVAAVTNDRFRLLAQNDMEESVIGSPVAVAVALHNALALGIGYTAGWALRLPEGVGEEELAELEEALEELNSLREAMTAPKPLVAACTGHAFTIGAIWLAGCALFIAFFGA